MAVQPDTYDLAEAVLQDRPCLVHTLDNGPVEDLQAETIIGGLFTPVSLQFVCASICQQRQAHLAEYFIHLDTHCSLSTSLPFNKTGIEYLIYIRRDVRYHLFLPSLLTFQWRLHPLRRSIIVEVSVRVDH